ncbi:MAG TPA: type II secretion system F family protein [Acidimicrobiia bacterium]|nr:type II secretion system F family protein [Acidimicrobiia bacterium]
MSAVLAAVAVFCLAYAAGPRHVQLAAYLGTDTPPVPVRRRRIPIRALAVGATAGGLAAVAAAPGQTVALTVVGGLAGSLAHRAAASTRRQRRAARLVQELPTVADTLALHVLAGESVATALHRFTSAASGVAADELGAALGAAAGGLEDALRAASSTTAHPEAARLYDLLGHAHRTGGRLTEALTELAIDYRAALARDLTAEGGRRALTTYGPILALMIPVTLLFLMYPTLAGLNALASTP